MININAFINRSSLTLLSDIIALEWLDPETIDLQQYSHLSGCNIRAHRYMIDVNIKKSMG